MQVHAFNDAIRRLRLSPLTSSGRNEWEYRLAQEGSARAALARLDEIEARAVELGHTPAEVYAGVGARPALLPWSLEALAWRRTKGRL